MDMKSIKIAIVDVDGTLTNGMYTVDENGVTSKDFYTRDFWAMQRLQEEGIQVLILTHCYDTVIDKKIECLPGKAKVNLFLKRLDWSVAKEQYLENMFNSIPGFGWESAAYIGDSENDLNSMRKAAFTACPNDSVSIIKEESNYVATAKGGYGAVYEIVEYMLGKRKLEG
jgi:3-deoxy-D-manno-octulosonate 8-phosphate phosphatase (KDO 8-P phosphatase)